MRPISYFTNLPKAIQKATGRKPKSTKLRSEDELRQGVKEWIAGKFDEPQKVKLRNKIAPGPWSRELVHHVVKFEHELALLEQFGIKLHRLRDVIRDLKRGDHVVQGAAGAHLLELVAFGAE